MFQHNNLILYGWSSVTEPVDLEKVKNEKDGIDDPVSVT